MTEDQKNAVIGVARAGVMTHTALMRAREIARVPGSTALDVDTIVGRFLGLVGMKSSAMGFHGYPAHTCVSINDAAVHGVPDNRVIMPGDVVKIDLAAEFEGWIADACVTLVVGFNYDPREAADGTFMGISKVDRNEVLRRVKTSMRLRDAIADVVWNQNFATFEEIESHIRSYVSHDLEMVISEDWSGHGVGRELHEWNFRDRPDLEPGMIFTIEPLLIEGTDGKTIVDGNGWTTRTASGRLSYQHEITVAVADSGELVPLTAALPDVETSLRKQGILGGDERLFSVDRYGKA